MHPAERVQLPVRAKVLPEATADAGQRRPIAVRGHVLVPELLRVHAGQ